MAEPRRRQILDVLAGGERPVNDLVRLLGLSQPLVSKHLVYKAWSTPELVKRWWSGKPRRDDARRDRPSGRRRVAIRDGEGGRIVEVAFHGEYREIFPDERIISTEVYEGMPGGEALNTVTFTEAEGRGRTIIDSNAYMTLATADGDGRPWVSPVWYAAAGYAEFYWVSSPEARHSRNLAARPEVSIVIFDSRAPIGTGQAVYVSAIVEELTGADLDQGIVIFSGRSKDHGASEWKPEDVRPTAIVCTER